MNASANLRASMIRTSALIPVAAPTTRLHRQSIEVSEAERRRIIHTLNCLEYQIQCDIDREKYPPPSNKEKVSETLAVELGSSRLSQIGRMFTIFPYKDMNWIVTMFFVVGSVAFVINASFVLFPLLDSNLAFETLATAAIPATIMIGASMFMTGGVLGVFAAFNADRGTLEDFDASSIYSSSPAIYRPALLGSKAWAWVPSAADAASLLKTVPFLAGLLQLSGGTILTTAAVASLPGFVDPTNLYLTQLLVFMPQVIGGSLFFISNFALVIHSQEHWFIPQFWNTEWQGAAWNTIASAGFAITGLLLLSNKILEASAVSFGASTAFLIGSTLQWYTLMEFHATGWAA